MIVIQRGKMDHSHQGETVCVWILHGSAWTSGFQRSLQALNSSCILACVHFKTPNLLGVSILAPGQTRGDITQRIEYVLCTCDGLFLGSPQEAKWYNSFDLRRNVTATVPIAKRSSSLYGRVCSHVELFKEWKHKYRTVTVRQDGKGLHSPFLPLLLVAFKIRSDLLGEPLVLSELGLGITCIVWKIWKLSYNYRHNLQLVRRRWRGNSSSSLEGLLGIIFSPEVLIQRRFWCSRWPPYSGNTASLFL